VIWLKPRQADVEVGTLEVPKASFLMELNKDFRLRTVSTPEELAEKVRV
jgi:hypothetical protein